MQTADQLFVTINGWSTVLPRNLAETVQSSQDASRSSVNIIDDLAASQESQEQIPRSEVVTEPQGYITTPNRTMTNESGEGVYARGARSSAKESLDSMMLRYGVTPAKPKRTYVRRTKK